MIKRGLAPIIFPNSQILILGSMPSEISLVTGQYYGNARNHFWHILSSVFDVDVPQSYREKHRCLHDLRVGLWDVIATCQRKGALDANIKDVTVNDFQSILAGPYSWDVIGCNGGLAFKLFEQHVSTDIPIIKLPSSSPAHTLPLVDKVASWRQLLTYTRTIHE